MKRLLVATDFSTRSDRAIRRAGILAKQFNASMVLIHVVDDDQPPSLVTAERREAQSLLQGIAQSLSKTEALSVDTKVFMGQPFDGLLRAASEFKPDLLVVGPHRRQILKDVFSGTTGERTIRQGRWPVLVAAAVPAHSYRRALITTDFSDCSAKALTAAQELGFFEAMPVMIMHAYDAPAESLIYRASMTLEETKDYLMQGRARAENDMLKFLRDAGIESESRILKIVESSTAAAILDCAHERQIDLVVVGAHGRTAVEKMFLGSVTDGVLRQSDTDVLVVPCAVPSENYIRAVLSD